MADPGLVAVMVHWPADRASSVLPLMTQGPFSLRTAVAPEAVPMASPTLVPALTGIGEFAGHAVLPPAGVTEIASVAFAG